MSFTENIIDRCPDCGQPYEVLDYEAQHRCIACQVKRRIAGEYAGADENGGGA